jgi:hypothetical protein
MNMSNVSMNQDVNPVSAPAPAAAPALAPTMHYREAYELALPASQALSADALIAVNIDVPTAMTTVIGKLPQILALRAQVAKRLPEFDIANFDLLSTYTFATGHAQALFAAASAPPEALVTLNEQGIVLRDLLYSDAVALSNRGLINGDKLSGFKANVGYKNLAFDLLGLAALLRGSWDAIASKTALQLSELDQADDIGEKLMAAVAVREQGPTIAATQSAQRQRNFTLFANAYDQVRRAITFLRWTEDDVDEIAPSLYAGRNTGRKKPDVPQPGPVPAPSPVVNPPPSPVVSAPAPHAAPGSSAVAPANMPGANPFASVS